jgi:hypothetical protein
MHARLPDKWNSNQLVTQNYYEFTTVHHFGASETFTQFSQMDIKSRG